MKVIVVNFKRVKKIWRSHYEKYDSHLGNAIKKEVTIEFMTLKNRNLSYIGREMIIHLYTSSVLIKATRMEKLSGKQNLRYLKKFTVKK